MTDLPTQGGHCIGTTVLLEGQQFIYQRHDFEGQSGAINPGHHAMLACDSAPGSALLSFSPLEFAASSPPRAALPDHLARSQLIPGRFVESPTAMPAVDGRTVDMTAFPNADGVDDVFLVCSTRNSDFAWSAATFSGRGYAWLSLRRRNHFPSTLVWLSNGGRFGPPWNGRHAPVLGVEDMIGHFACGLSASSQPNSLTARGIATCLTVRRGVPLRIPYIQGLLRIPVNFGRVIDVQPSEAGKLIVSGASGIKVESPCHWEFLADECIPGLCEA